MSNTKTMLIVDDSRVSRMMIRKFAEQVHSDLHFIEAGSGDEALEQVANAKVDIMTIDVNMPGMDGFTLAEALIKQFPKARISLLTANIQQASQEKAQNLGVGFIPKPITEEKISDFVSNPGN